MTTWFTGWRVSLRVARREASRARGRALLVVAMLMLPVAALAFAAVEYKSFSHPPAVKAARHMGQGQLVLAWIGDGQVQQVPDDLLGFATGPSTRSGEVTEPDVLAQLPAGSRVLSDRGGQLVVHTATGIATLRARLLDYADPLAKGVLTQLAGRAPATANEVALTRAAAKRLGVGVGGTMRLVDGGRALSVVGVVEDPGDLRSTTIVLRPGALPDAALGSVAPWDRRWIAATPGPVTWTQVKALNTKGIIALSRDVLEHPPSKAEQYSTFRVGNDTGNALAVTSLVAAVAILEVVLLAGPAFAVGVRRRRRDLALVAAAGGTPAHLRRVVLADGVVLGLGAAATGLLLGTSVAVLGNGWVEEHLAHERGELQLYPSAMLVLAGVALGTGLVAALIPAWTASRMDVVASLAGRRGITRSRKRWVVLGLVLVVVGVALTGLGAWDIEATTIIAGLVVIELGLVVCTPALVGLVARIGRWLPLAARIAMRDTSRNRSSAAPAISAVMAAVVGSLAIGVVISAHDRRQQEQTLRLSRSGDVVLFSVTGGKGGIDPVPASAVAALRDTFPVAEVHDVYRATCVAEPCFVSAAVPRAKACPVHRGRDGTLSKAQQKQARRDPRCAGQGKDFEYFGHFGSDTAMTFVVDEASVAALTHASRNDVTAITAALREGRVVVSEPLYVEAGRVTLDVGHIREGPEERGAGITAPGWSMPHPTSAPLSMMTLPTAQRLGLGREPMVTLATTTRLPTTAEEDRLRAALGGTVEMDVDRGVSTQSAPLLVLAVVAGVITLGAAAIATGLAAADGRQDLVTLAAVGASPRVRRVLSMSQAGVIAGMGSLLGVLAGIGVSAAVLEALNRRFVDVWPAPAAYPIDVPWTNVAIALLVVPAVAMAGAGLLTRSRLPIERRRE